MPIVYIVHHPGGIVGVHDALANAQRQYLCPARVKDQPHNWGPLHGGISKCRNKHCLWQITATMRDTHVPGD